MIYLKSRLLGPSYTPETVSHGDVMGIRILWNSIRSFLYILNFKETFLSSHLGVESFTPPFNLLPEIT